MAAAFCSQLSGQRCRASTRRAKGELPAQAAQRTKHSAPGQPRHTWAGVALQIPAGSRNKSSRAGTLLPHTDPPAAGADAARHAALRVTVPGNFFPPETVAQAFLPRNHNPHSFGFLIENTSPWKYEIQTF